MTKLLPASVRERQIAPAGTCRAMLADYTLKEPELLLMSDVSTTSFDGRYFRWGR